LYGLGANARAALDRKGEVVVSARLTGKGNPPKVGASRYDDRLPAVLVSPARAQALGLTPRSTVTAFVARRALTSQQRDAIDALRVVWIDKADVSHAQIDNAPDPAQLYALFAALALVVAILVILMSLALSAADTRDERDMLAVVGANPSTLRAVSARKAFVLAAVGAVLALPVGLLPAIVFVKAHVSYMRFAFPWLTVAVVTVGVPVGAAAAAWAGSAIALRYRPLRVSTLRYD
jgi:ABC-type antimicrobial peptide transport system permease subunit